MSEENSSEVTIFRTARKIDCNHERSVFLDQACHEKPELRKRMEKLLAAAENESLFLEQPASGLMEVPQDSQLSPSLLPNLESDDSQSCVEVQAMPNKAVALTDANKGVLRLMDATLAEIPRVSLREEEHGDGPIQRPSSEEVPPQPVNSRYRLDAEIARGGMGAILRGRDVDIGRDLAIKVLLTSHKDCPEVVQRFVEEAQISGQLQHPGIAPVYDIGQFVDERPYMSMKLVKGDTLSKQLADREDIHEGCSKLIGVFKQICDTIAYAHSRGVIHRDLKPANIMVGAFGEVQVMDWGLAKVLSVGGVADEKRAKQSYDGTSII
ncbi:MAG: serine/threonine-protein kinase, partial [Planctomycetota bacterium]